MNTARIFKNGNSQAVRLPKDCRFDSAEVGINRIGDMVVLYPKDTGWDLFRESLGQFSEDFMKERRQPEKPDRRKSL